MRNFLSPDIQPANEKTLTVLRKRNPTTPAVRAEIAGCNELVTVPAQRFGITEQAVYKWRTRCVFANYYRTAPTQNSASKSVLSQIGLG